MPENVETVNLPTSPSAMRKVAVTLLLCCGFVIAVLPEHAVASCGDYLQMSNQHPSDSVTGVPTILSLLDPLPEPPRRCHGPGCSQSPNVPVASLVDLPKLISVKSFAVLACSSSVDDDLFLPVVNGHASLSYSFRLSSDIFRPPRLVSGHC